MAIDAKVLRINELSKKSKTVGLTDIEKEEQQKLRKEYVAGFRKGLETTLENVVIMDKDGNKSPLQKKN